MPKPTKQIRLNAQRALAMRDKAPASKRGMTRVGLARANQIAKGRNLSMTTVRRTFSFLSRAKEYYKPGQNTPGTQAYLGWGGNAGLSFAKRILKK